LLGITADQTKYLLKPYNVLILLEHIVTNTCTNYEVGPATIGPSFFTVTNEWLLQLNSSERTCLPGVIMEPRSMDGYYTSEEIAETWRQINGKRSEWTVQQHEEWHIFLYYQCLARDRRYKRKSPSECHRDTVPTSVKLSTVFLAILTFHDNIFSCAVWSKNYIYEFVCPDCSIREVGLIMMGALFGLVCLVHTSSVLLFTNWKHKRWVPFALAVLWTIGCLLDGV
jgi:hypothetical protein